MALRVGIVGCGPGGQAAAALLARDGHAVRVFERAPRLGPIGAGLLVQPTGASVLARLGVLDRVASLAAPISHLYGETHRGRTVLDLAYADLEPGLRGLGVQRGALSAALLHAMRAAGATLTTDAEIVGVDNGAEGSLLRDARGAEHGPFDLVVAADGARSTLRSRFPSLVRRDRAYAWGAVWCVADDAEGRYSGVLRQVYRGTGEMIGFLPSGRASGDAPTRVSLFWSTRVARAGAFDDTALAEWTRRVRALTPLADPILDGLRDPARLITATYRDVVMRRIHVGRVVFLGDAAHAMSPQLGQGVNLALLDAASLADALAAERDPARALARHARQRHRNVAFYQRASRWLTPVFQSSLEPLAPPRDLLMRPMSRIRWVRRQMLLSLAGVKTGTFTGMLRHATPPGAR